MNIILINIVACKDIFGAISDVNELLIRLLGKIDALRQEIIRYFLSSLTKYHICICHM